MQKQINALLTEIANPPNPALVQQNQATQRQLADINRHLKPLFDGMVTPANLPRALKTMALYGSQVSLNNLQIAAGNPLQNPTLATPSPTATSTHLFPCSAK